MEKRKCSYQQYLGSKPPQSPSLDTLACGNILGEVNKNYKFNFRK